MKNYTRSGAIKTRSHGSAVESGQPIQIGSRAGVAMGKYEANQEGEYLQGGVIEFKKAAGVAMTQGDLVEWSNAGSEVVADTLGDFELGEVDADALAGDEVVRVLVNSMPYSLM